MLILQWNLNGFHPRKKRLELLISKYQPEVICLQETNFKNQFCATLKGYTAINKNRLSSSHASGGVATYIKNNLHFELIPFHSDLEVVAATISMPEKLTVCNLYISGSKEATKSDLESLSKHLPTPLISLGDLNGHNLLWHSNSTNSRGRVIEDWFLNNDNLVFLNNGQPTNFSSASGNQSIIDLTFATVNIATNIIWNALEDLHDSDYYPITILLLEQQTYPKDPGPRRWLLQKAD